MGAGSGGGGGGGGGGRQEGQPPPPPPPHSSFFLDRGHQEMVPALANHCRAGSSANNLALLNFEYLSI